jgi:glycine betaine/proline transport system ATP-binding protein
MSSKRIIVRGVSKVFGPDTVTALSLLRSGADKDEILARTRAVVGLRDVSFDVDEGEVLVVMGLSGSGKSTMLRCINRLIEPTEGSIVVDGVEVTSLSTKDLLRFRRAKFGMVFQHFALFPNRTIFDNVAYGLEVQKIEPRLRAQKTLRAIEVVGLKGWEKSYPGQLSGGMQQRAGLARALAVDADILLMDEAFSALDPLIRRGMQQELRELQRNLRKTVVFVSHDLDEAISLGGRIVLMKDGEIVQIGTAEEILLKPATEYVRRFVEHIDVSSVLTVERIADRGLPTLAPHFTLGEAWDALRGSEAESWFVVDPNGQAIGRVGRGALRSAPPDSSTVAEVMRTRFPTIAASATLKAALPLVASERDAIAVVDGERYVGSITSRDALAALAGAVGATAPAEHGDPPWTGPSPSSRSTNYATRPSPGSRLTVPT